MKLALTGALIAGLLGVPVPLLAGNWVYFDACGVEIPDEFLFQADKFVYAPAPQIKGYLVNTSAVMLMAELTRYEGIRCTVLVGPGGNTVHVIGNLEEVREKLEK